MNCTQALLSLLLLSPCSDGPSGDTAVLREQPAAAVPAAPHTPTDAEAPAPTDIPDSRLDRGGTDDTAAVGGSAERRVPTEAFD